MTTPHHDAEVDEARTLLVDHGGLHDDFAMSRRLRTAALTCGGLIAAGFVVNTAVLTAVAIGLDPDDPRVTERAAVVQALAAISAIAGSLLLVGITAYYASTTREMVSEMRATRQQEAESIAAADARAEQAHDDALLLAKEMLRARLDAHAPRLTLHLSQAIFHWRPASGASSPGGGAAPFSLSRAEASEAIGRLTLDWRVANNGDVPALVRWPQPFQLGTLDSLWADGSELLLEAGKEVPLTWWVEDALATWADTILYRDDELGSWGRRLELVAVPLSRLVEDVLSWTGVVQPADRLPDGGVRARWWTTPPLPVEQDRILISRSYPAVG